MLPHEGIERRVLQAATLETATASLADLLSSEFSVSTDGFLYYTRQQVARVRGLKIEVFAREHPPPHFHVSGGGIDAVFSLTDGAQIQGCIGGRDRALVQWWYARSRSVLIEAWNTTRPANCPVGPVVE